MIRYVTLLPLLMALLFGCRPYPTQAQVDPHDSGGPLMAEQAAYNVTFYDLDIRIRPDSQSIQGTLTATARITSPLDVFVLDLDPVLAVDSVWTVYEDGATEPLGFVRQEGKLRIHLTRMKQPGEMVTVAVVYGGQPRVAPNPPWDGGFTWAETTSGAPWIATSCQTNGADLWWPVKDHVSDEPDSMALHVTVPDPLVVATNGRLQQVEANGDGTSTHHWFISTPINAYNVALNIAPYRVLEDSLTSVAGETFPVVFYVLPEDYERGQKLFPEILDHLRFYEETVGPYPFRADKYGVVQTPHLGMEHQTIIAYGAAFDNGAMTGGRDWGFDALHHHELAHEWWGNLVTNADWRDMWLHEGFGSYMQALYAEKLDGAEGYRAYLQSIRSIISNSQPLAPRKTTSARQIYGGDIYFKGAWTLHTLRYLVGEEVFRMALRRMAYPTEEYEKLTNGDQCRFATTDDFLHLVEDLSGQDLDWFFEVYLRQPILPQLHVKQEGTQLKLIWEVPNKMAFSLPVEVQVGEEIRRVAMKDGMGTLTIPAGTTPIIDPNGWILMAK